MCQLAVRSEFLKIFLDFHFIVFAPVFLHGRIDRLTYLAFAFASVVLQS